MRSSQDSDAIYSWLSGMSIRASVLRPLLLGNAQSQYSMGGAVHPRPISTDQSAHSHFFDALVNLNV